VTKNNLKWSKPIKVNKKSALMFSQW